jgi:hypothetical protein
VSLSVLQLTPEDMFRAEAMFRELPDDLVTFGVKVKGLDPYDIIDETGDRHLRRVLTIWCVKSRTDESFTWAQAATTPFEAMFLPSDEDESPPPTPGPENAGTEPGTNNGAGSKAKRRVAEAASS